MESVRARKEREFAALRPVLALDPDVEARCGVAMTGPTRHSGRPDFSLWHGKDMKVHELRLRPVRRSQSRECAERTSQGGRE